MTHRLFLLLVSFLAFPSFAFSANDGKGNTCPMVRIVPERLPDMNIPRNGHSIFYANGELTVTGGHTTNFVPTQTAEYYADGEWHQMPMAYCHDNGFSVLLRSGEVIIGGGHDEPLGVGQTFMVERYTPATHSFEGFGCLDRRRTMANAIQLADGRVIISGNHFATDAIACYDGNSQVKHVKDVMKGNNRPWILPTAADDAVIVGSRDTRQQPLDTIWADRLRGDAFRVPLLEQYRLQYLDRPFASDNCFIGDEERGDYSYLLPATDKNGQLVIVLMRDTCFTLLPTAHTIPMRSQWGPIEWNSPVIADREHRCGYVVGYDSVAYNRQYVLRIDYAHQPAHLTVYYTDELAYSTDAIPMLSPDGDLILAGGISNNNYKPLAAVWRYHFGTDPAAASTGKPVWLWVLICLAVIGVVVYLIIYVRRRSSKSVTIVPVQTDDTSEELMQRITLLMDEQQPYLQSRLKQSDIAVELGVSTTSISDCISSCRGISFQQLLAEYRVHHAQQLLTQQPDMKLAAVFAESGFTSESTFFRTFKTVTGLSPKEWLAQHVNHQVHQGTD